jgi:hypothetical protein
VIEKLYICGIIKSKSEVSIVSEKKAKRYVSDDAQLMTEWNWEKNTEISPDKIMTGSGKTVWWKCLKGHEWQATPNNRTSHKPQGCPYCSNHRILAGFNDLATTNPDLAAEWHPTQNGSLTPQNVTFGSNKKVWWICHKGHEYESSIKNRVAGQGCPYCAGRKVLIGYNDLQTINPTLASEWNYEKNGDLMPTYVTTNSNKKAWWKCRKGHEWLASISNRNNGNGCPICSSERHTSFPDESSVCAALNAAAPLPTTADAHFIRGKTNSPETIDSYVIFCSVNKDIVQCFYTVNDITYHRKKQAVL